MGNRSALFRFRSSAPRALIHLLISFAVACIVAAWVLIFWFPAPFANISGGYPLFFLIVSVDLVCGPLLTLMLLHDQKTKKARMVDLALIVLVQISALAYGVYTLALARPLAVVFEVDRFRVVSYADIDISEKESLPDWATPWGAGAPRILGTRLPRTSDEKFESLDASLQGVEKSQRPDWWQPYEKSQEQVKGRAMPLVMLFQMHPSKEEEIRDAAQKVVAKQNGSVNNLDDLLWLPVVGRQTMDWVALIDPVSMYILGYLNADGFGTDE